MTIHVIMNAIAIYTTWNSAESGSKLSTLMEIKLLRKGKYMELGALRQVEVPCASVCVKKDD